MNPFNYWDDDWEWLGDTEFDLVAIAEAWHNSMSPEIGVKDAEDLVTQMQLISLDEANNLQRWFEL